MNKQPRSEGTHRNFPTSLEQHSKMADDSNLPSTSGNKKENKSNRKRKNLSTEDVLDMLDSDSSNYLLDDLQSDDSLDNESDSDTSLVRTGDVEIVNSIRTDSVDRSELDSQHYDSDLDSDYTPDNSDNISDSTDSSEDEETTVPAAVRGRGRGRGRGRQSTPSGVQPQVNIPTLLPCVT